MEPFVEEKKELDEKIKKLDAFLLSPKFWELDANQRYLLRAQAEHMNLYSAILGRRIESF